MNNILKRSAVAISMATALVFGVEAKIELPNVMGDNMVLQQQTDARLWGNATPDSKVTVKTSWDKKKYTTQADANGRWELKVATPIATSEPQTIELADKDSKHTLSNILIGEVWYCSGQSNMEMPVRGFHRQPVDGSLDVILQARAERPIRMFTVKKDIQATPQTNCGGQWDEHTPAGVAECSATAYFFADYLNKMLDIPVGLIMADWGGTRVQPWMSREAIEPFGFDLSHLDKPIDPKERGINNKPSTLYNAMVAPILPYTIKGMLWYQGESNSSEPELYAKLMKAFVQDMRNRFGLGDIPFYYVQIAPFDRYGGKELAGICKLRLAQAQLMKDLPNCGMAVTMDIGNPVNIHPTNKMDVGKRLAYWTLAKDYGKNEFAFSGPVFNHFELRGNKAYVYFDNTGGGVCPLEQQLDGFEVAGEDGVYHPAYAIVEGGPGLLAVWSEDVAVPKKIRYGHRPYFVGTLFDNFGLPASPFVTTGELE